MWLCIANIGKKNDKCYMLIDFAIKILCEAILHYLRGIDNQTDILRCKLNPLSIRAKSLLRAYYYLCWLVSYFHFGCRGTFYMPFG